MPHSTGSSVLPPDRPGSPGSLIVSFAGTYLRELGGWIPVAAMIDCLSSVGLAAPSVRQAIVRLKSRGFFDAERRGSEAGYRLTEAGLGDLTSGDRRIFRPSRATVEDGWVLAVFSVPEADRHLRHELRTELAWLGFGTVSPGVWIAPRPLADPTRALLTDAGLDRYVTWFGAQHLTAIDVAAWWDLDALREQYETFLANHRAEASAAVSVSPSAASSSAVSSSALTDEQAFARQLRLIDEWRLFPRLDPGLPDPLLPSNWPAKAAWELFQTLHARWSPGGLRHVRSIVC